MAFLARLLTSGMLIRNAESIVNICLEAVWQALSAGIGF